MTPVPIALLPAQAALLDDVTSPVLVFCGGWGFGKTRGLSWKGIQLAGLNAPTPIPIYEPSWKQIENVLEPMLRDCLIELGVWRLTTHNRRDHDMTFPLNGSECTLHLRNASNPEHVLGRNDPASLVDEVDSIGRVALRNIRSRVRVKSAACRQLVLAGTPNRGKRGPFYAAAEGSPAAGTNVIRGATTDNPFLPDDYVDVMLGALSDVEQARYIRGEFVDMSGRVYTQWDGGRHLRPWEQPSRGSKHVMAIDFGAVFTPWLMAEWGRPGEEGEWAHFHGEILGKDTHTIEMARRASAWWVKFFRRHYGDDYSPQQAAGLVEVYCDPAGAPGQRKSASDVHILEDEGFAVHVLASHDSVSDRVSAVQMRLSRTSPTCVFVDDARAPYLAKCFAEQEYADDGTPKKGKARDGESGLDHGADAAGYFLSREWPTYGPSTYFAGEIH